MSIALQLDLFTGLARPGEAVPVGFLGARRAADDPRPPPSSPSRALSLNSLAAHEKHRDEFRGRKALIMDCVRLANQPLTVRQIRDRLYGPQADMNLVRPRVSDLVAAKKLMYVHEVEDADTHEWVSQVWLA